MQRLLRVVLRVELQAVFHLLHLDRHRLLGCRSYIALGGSIGFDSRRTATAGSSGCIGGSGLRYVSGAILSWVTIITELSTAICLYTVRTQTLTLAIYTYVSRGNDGIAAALATILSLTTVVSLLLFMKLSKSKDVTL